jgi:hypothetical protein
MSAPAPSARGEASTVNATKILRRLCKHWSHKYAVEFDDSDGTIQLRDTRCTLQAMPDRLRVTLASPDDAVLARMREVVAEHLQRMSGDEALAVRWDA